MSTVPVRVSAAQAWQRFHGCEPEYIAEICHSKCCDAPTRPTGTLITILPGERAAITARGGTVDGHLLVTPDRVCPFKTDAYLCGLHGTTDKPLTCVADPFTLNRRDTLVVRNRYRMMPCYFGGQRRGWVPDSEWPPAFRAFRASLDRLFGADEARRLVDRLEEVGPTGGFVEAAMRATIYAALRFIDNRPGR